MQQITGAVRGRPLTTSHAEIESAAFGLFSLHGFDATTVDQIAEAAGIGRRTLFRYFPSKNDIPWGRFDASLHGFAAMLDASDPNWSISTAVGRAIVAFNDVPEEAIPQHRQRMSLILNTATLQAHSALRYREWRAVVAGYVAVRLGERPEDLVPRTMGHVSLALAVSAYEQWLQDPEHELNSLLRDAMSSVAPLLAGIELPGLGA
jgi:mycofactocin system transcriptional regulator